MPISIVVVTPVTGPGNAVVYLSWDHWPTALTPAL